GSANKQLLIRALGPVLGAAPFNVPGVIANPRLTLFNQAGTELATNDDWGTASGVAAASATAGAFALPAGSLDAALVANLAPGAYTVQIDGVAGATGVGLVEIYEVVEPPVFSANKMMN